MSDVRKCQRCKGTKKLYQIQAWCRDLYTQVHLSSGKEYEGYVPEWIGPNGYGDAVGFIICRHCGTVQGNWPELDKRRNQFKYGKVD